MSKTLGLALGSGGGRGIAHIGFLKALEEEKVKPNFISGSSMGAIVGACYAMGMSPQEMHDQVKSLKKREIMDYSVNPIFSGAFLRSKKIVAKLKSYFGNKTFADLDIPFYAVCTDMLTGKPFVSERTDRVTEVVAASSSMPGVFRPIKYKDTLLCDGAVLNRVPCFAVKNAGADVVVGIDVLGKIQPQENKRHNLIKNIFRMFEIVDCNLTERIEKNSPADLFIVPDMGDANQFDFKQFEYIYECGYRCGKIFSPKIKELIE